MLEAFEILTTSGIVVWRKHYANPPLSPTLINSLITDVFIEERQSHAPTTYRKDKYVLKWTTAKDAGLVFVAIYQSLVSLSWVDQLLAAVKALYVKHYATSNNSIKLPQLNAREFDTAFEALVRRLDSGSTARRLSLPDSDGASELTPPSSSASVADDEPPPSLPVPQFKRPAAPSPRLASALQDDTGNDATPVPTPDASRPGTPSSRLVTAKLSRRAKQRANAAFNNSGPASSGDESPARAAKTAKKNVKAKRQWDADGMAMEGDDRVLDYSAAPGDADGEAQDLDVEDVDNAKMGSRTGKGQFVLKDLDDELDAILASSKEPTSAPAQTAVDENSGLLGTASTKITGLFRNFVGGKKLTKADLQGPLQQMRQHLIGKNIAPAAADRLCSSVETDLLQQTTASFTSIDATIRTSMAKALTRILTPTSSLDLLRSITSCISGPQARPYVISIVGVNGVGKSTNLSKIAYFLLQNRFRVLVVAADTFRSGAVEQLRVHVRNLTSLSKREDVGYIELFEQGYGKDAATVARDAVTFASANATTEQRFDVVLIDTAGRRHNDTRLMSSLTKFSQLANPDKVFMVGEALVGTDSVAQARNFAKEFVDTKGKLRNNGVGLDGFIVSKCDTVGDMVGTLVSMVHATGIPVVFLGVGQHYGDLRGLNVAWAVDKLMK
ncbi:signal recognition particle, alpha subunit, N-terminal-domain-containing protein [Acrodontium crateriforme]|uniref:Signal recognition particle receptor subunit alpha homolog n=1 Tax=Acrodontium crateriforme TaxID=150365 RepID=A0AAQ3LYB2_9PEZI|nr:signal recognition particle, alpha subunit, N-terminal-domain-containing protein [Acrodontium crateriforme]